MTLVVRAVRWSVLSGVGVLVAAGITVLVGVLSPAVALAVTPSRGAPAAAVAAPGDPLLQRRPVPPRPPRQPPLTPRQADQRPGEPYRPPGVYQKFDNQGRPYPDTYYRREQVTGREIPVERDGSPLRPPPKPAPPALPRPGEPGFIGPVVPPAGAVAPRPAAPPPPAAAPPPRPPARPAPAKPRPKPKPAPPAKPTAAPQPPPAPQPPAARPAPAETSTPSSPAPGRPTTGASVETGSHSMPAPARSSRPRSQSPSQAGVGTSTASRLTDPVAVASGHE